MMRPWMNDEMQGFHTVDQKFLRGNQTTASTRS